MNDSNFRTEMAGLGRDFIGFLSKLWERSKDPGSKIPAEARIDLNLFVTAEEPEQRKMLAEGIEALLPAVEEQFKAQGLVKSGPLESPYSLAVFYAMLRQTLEIRTLQKCVKELEDRLPRN